MPQETAPVNFLTFGETLIQRNADYIGPYDADGGYTMHVAGAESNVALDLARLLPGRVRATWVSRLGSDPEGEMILAALRPRIKVVAPRVVGQKTGVQLLNHLGGGEVSRRYRRAGSAASRLTALEVVPLLDGCDILHVTGITPALSDACREAMMEVLRAARGRGVPVSVDANYREALWSADEARAVFDEMRPYAALFKVGRDEAETVWGGGMSARERARALREGDAQITVVTDAENGAVAFDGHNLISHAGFAVDVVDPVGAGDAFVAGFLAVILERHTLAELAAMDAERRANILRRAVRLANACGALVCSEHGDTEPMPDMRRALAFAGMG